jgi:colicin import membrane protein
LWQALALHVVLFAVLFAGLQLSQPNPPIAARGEVIEADLVDVGALSPSMQRALRRRPEPMPEPEPASLPEPVAEPVPPPVPDTLPPPVPDPAPVEQEAVQRDGQAPQVAQTPREQEAKRKPPEQAELDAQTPEADRLDQRIAAIRKRIEQARKARELAEQRQQQLADARPSAASSSSAPPPGNPDSLSAETASYAVGVQVAIERQWIRPDSIKPGQRCQVLIVQVPGGEVVDVQVSPGCPYDDLGKRSLEAAILKASPLPYAGFEAVFQRRLVLWFEPSE